MSEKSNTIPFEAHYSAWAMIKYLLLAIPVASLILWARWPRKLALIAITMTILVVVMSTVFLAIRYLIREPWIRADNDGLRWKPSTFQRNKAPWQDIEGLYLESGRYGDRMRINLRSNNQTPQPKGLDSVAIYPLDRTAEQIAAGLSPYRPVEDLRSA